MEFQVVGFDSGTGLPPPRDYRDQPQLFGEGDYPMVDRDALLRALPINATVVFGPIQDNVVEFVRTVSRDSPIGFVSMDVDYYWSTKECLQVFLGRPEQYLPLTIVYLDDISQESANPWVCELLAVREFNEENAMRKLHPFTFLRSRRIFKQTSWIDHIYAFHVLDHRWRSEIKSESYKQVVLDNAYL